jgi:hypothetical protein
MHAACVDTPCVAVQPFWLVLLVCAMVFMCLARYAYHHLAVHFQHSTADAIAVLQHSIRSVFLHGSRLLESLIVCMWASISSAWQHHRQVLRLPHACPGDGFVAIICCLIGQQLTSFCQRNRTVFMLVKRLCGHCMDIGLAAVVLVRKGWQWLHLCECSPELRGALSAACCFAAHYAAYVDDTILLHLSWGSTYHHAACMDIKLLLCASWDY